MKKIYYLIAMAVAAFTFTSCEDVPEPFGQPVNPKHEEVIVTPTGSGTADDPFNIAGIIEATKDLASGQTTEKDYYAKGYVESTDKFNDKYGSISYYICDDKDGKTKKFYVYSGQGLGNKSFTSLNDLKAGDEVIVCGKVTNYNGTIEFQSQNYIVELNGQKEGGGSGTGGDTSHGTAEAPLTVAQAIAAIDAESTISEAYVKGKISKIDSYNSTYKSITYWISDDGGTTTQLQVYSGKGLNGADFSAKEDLTVGQTVVIKGALKKFNETYEFDKSSQIISITIS